MHERYEPKSLFLLRLADGDVPLTGNEFAQANLAILIALMSDQDCSNRDWATFLLAQSDVDTVEAREALIRSARDEDEFAIGQGLPTMHTWTVLSPTRSRLAKAVCRRLVRLA